MIAVCVGKKILAVKKMSNRRNKMQMYVLICPKRRTDRWNEKLRRLISLGREGAR